MPRTAYPFRKNPKEPPIGEHEEIMDVQTPKDRKKQFFKQQQVMLDRKRAHRGQKNLSSEQKQREKERQ
ncbi:GL14629 [Drosophila persimilis]|uniref:GL14629 n=1 Tax=Drosophila persimilis TaxID=7234 RepID=B4GVP6_DROPE|nr:GL14629 [Drosophila persimilis]